MHLGIFAKTFPRRTLEETLDAIVEQGLTHVQFNLSCVGLPTLPERLDEDLCAGIARSFRQRGLTMAAISGTFNLCDPDYSRLQENLRRLAVLAAACRWLDTRIITLCTGTADPEDMWKWHSQNVLRSTWEKLVESMREAARVADRHEVTLAFEPELNNVVNSVCKARMLLDEVGSPWIRVVIDPANLVRPGDLSRMKEVFDEAFDWLAPEIILVHAKEPPLGEKPGERSTIELSDSLLKMSPKLYSEIVARVSAKNFEELSLYLRELARWHDFYQPFLFRLREMAYPGAVILHGFEEVDVPQKLTWLRAILAQVSSEG
ncbi:MAG TPA: sugar phosphate isomerase/epimerase [Isosphaeraceae bacterium]|nr:sugar phosphate isomerase/epimerase [Isosphaeraceae bacterium]